MAEDTFRQLTDKISTTCASYAKDSPAVMGAFHQLSKAASKEGALDKKTKELTALAIAIALRCDACIGFHVQKLIQYGANKEEITEICDMAVYMGGGPSLMYAAKALQAYQEFA